MFITIIQLFPRSVMLNDNVPISYVRSLYFLFILIFIQVYARKHKLKSLQCIFAIEQMLTNCEALFYLIPAKQDHA